MAALAPGTRLGAYEIVRLLGRGGMGEVYEARDTRLNRPVAIKVLPAEFAADTDRVRRFEREARAAAALNHPHIVTLHSVETIDGVLFLTMELIEGRSLATAIPRGGMPLDELLTIAIPVTEAIAAAHRTGIMHRDLKPANIMVGTGAHEGRVKVLDFGLAKLLSSAFPAGHRTFTPTESVTVEGRVLGTVAYMSPEQAVGASTDARSDLFSIGVVLYEMATGERPFTGDSHVAVLSSILKDTPRPISDLNKALPAEFSRIVQHCLVKDPERRYQTSLDLRNDLQTLKDDLESRRQPSGQAARRLWAAALRRRWVLAAATMVGVLLAGAGLWKWTLGQRVLAAPRSLAVVEIENLAQDPSFDWMDRGVAELLTTNLASASSIQVISTERVRELIGRRVKGEGHLPVAQARDVAQEAHADLFLSGALIKLGSRIRLDLRIQDTATGRVLFADKVEGADAQAVFAMADTAAAGILTHLAPAESAPKPNVGASLTANLEALRSYEEGLGQFDQIEFPAAQKAFQRAIDLDPQFVMAHYYLARSLSWSDILAARRTIARAVQLAERAPVPRLQKLLAQAIQFRLDERATESVAVLETARREFPREIELVYELGNARYRDWRFAEAATLYEDVVRMDERHVLVHADLGYAYAFLGDLTRAIASQDRYGTLLPPAGIGNAIINKGDAYMITGHYDEALAQYRTTDSRELMALAGLHAGDYGLVDSVLKTTPKESVSPLFNSNAWYYPWGFSSISGDVAVARGQLTRAVGDFEEMAELIPHNPQWPWWALLKASQIFLEERQPEAVLALARRHTTPWGAALRGTAYLLLHKDAEAEQEFAEARQSITPLAGDYVAEKTVEFHRLLAASYAGRYDQVIQMWPSLPRSWWHLYALEVGKAYLASGALTEAQSHLRWAWTKQLEFGSDPSFIQHNVLTWMLADFYLGQVDEKSGRRDEAVARYKKFLKHFDHSPAPLVQIAEARAALARLQP